MDLSYNWARVGRRTTLSGSWTERSFGRYRGGLSTRLDPRPKIGDDVRYVQEKWTEGLGKPYVDGFGGGLYEVRTKHDTKEYRVLFCIEDDTMILLHGFIKKTKKTPSAGVALARRRQKE